MSSAFLVCLGGPGGTGAPTSSSFLCPYDRRTFLVMCNRSFGLVGVCCVLKARRRKRKAWLKSLMLICTWKLASAWKVMLCVARKIVRLKRLTFLRGGTPRPTRSWGARRCA